MSAADMERYVDMVRNGVKPADAMKFIVRDAATERMKRERAAKKAASAMDPIADIYAGKGPQNADEAAQDSIAAVYAGEPRT